MDSYIKDPDARLDYKKDWSEWLAEVSDTISESTWTANSENITIDAIENSSVDAVVWLEGGIDGETYIITNHIVTVGGRADDHSIKIKMKHK